MEITVLQGKLYQREPSFMGFDGLSEETIESLRESYNEAEESKTESDGLRNYIETLRYLTSPNVRLKLPTFDDRIIFLIQSVDPNMLMYKMYASAQLTTTAQINEADEQEKKVLLAQRKNEVAEIVRKIRHALGFYDNRLLKYESILYNKYLKTTDFIKEASRDYTPNIIRAAKTVRSFQNVTDERYKELADLVTLWETQTNGKGNAKLAAYTILEQNNILGLASTKEQLLFFILAVDPDLSMLTIHEEESRKDRMEERLKEEFGVASDDLLRVERLYHQRFCPDKKISVWSL